MVTCNDVNSISSLSLVRYYFFLFSEFHCKTFISKLQSNQIKNNLANLFNWLANHFTRLLISVITSVITELFNEPIRKLKKNNYDKRREIILFQTWWKLWQLLSCSVIDRLSFCWLHVIDNCDIRNSVYLLTLNKNLNSVRRDIFLFTFRSDQLKRFSLTNFWVHRCTNSVKSGIQQEIRNLIQIHCVILY